jgi:RNA-binding protein YhbY
MFNYEKPNNLITILDNKNDFLNAYSRERYRATRHNYPIASLSIIIPEKITSKKIKKFIVDSFRESDILYCDYSNQSLQVLLPYTPQEHLDSVINRIIKSYDNIKSDYITNQLKFKKVVLTKNTDDDINSIIDTLEHAEHFTHGNDDVRLQFNSISKKLLTIIKKGSCDLNFINYYSGMKLNYKTTLVSIDKGSYTFETDPMQLAAITNTNQTLIEIKKYGFHINATIENVDFVLNRVTLTKLVVMTYNNINRKSLTVELKEQLSARLISVGSQANIQLSAISFNEIYGSGDISQLVINNNTLRLLICKENIQYTLLVKFIYSKFNGRTQTFTLHIMDTSEKSIELFQDLVTTRSRECIKELKYLCA